ncbi:MAG: type ISP restriction/modification enzyme [Bacteroidales bacterium]|nr:type ISP restriction/modification enzyme [Bacteroidales bacterium]
MMAAKAKLLAIVIENALADAGLEEEFSTVNEANNTLRDQLTAFREVLIHDITPKEFADIYAQTIAYGMFAARLHDTSLETFSRQEASELIPRTNPFLRKLFQYVAGYDLDGRIVWIVDGLADLFRATDVAELLKNFGSATQTQDPIIHFYETFLAEYDPKLRKARGVWYTPHPVVNFIVRAVDDILITEFGFPNGLADTSKIKIKHKEVTKATSDQRSKLKEVEVEHEVHKVQILDPASGTGTFLAEVVKQIYRKFEGQQGIWSDYVEEHLIPRLNGFEILMASYAMAHLKLDLLLSETGYKPKKEQRFRVFLTNSLEEYHPGTGTLFANWLSTEANEANFIKRDTPVMVVLGNPPYSVSSSNKSEWIEKLTTDYKKDLNERNIQPLSDDYIKFIRFGQHFIDKNGEGILAYISNNSFLDGIIHRQMRKFLLNSFDKIFVLDLHGNAKKKETTPDGFPDQNVFDIMQGVSINIFVKTGKKKNNELGEVYHSNLWGTRECKYKTLNHEVLTNVNWSKLTLNSPNFYFIKKDFEHFETYQSFISITELFHSNNAGLATEFDEFVIKDTLSEASRLLDNLTSLNSSELQVFYGLDVNKLDKIERAIKDIKDNNTKILKIDYRPFDIKYTLYTGKSNGIMGRPRNGIMKNMLHDNLALLTCRQQTTSYFHHSFMSKYISERCSVSLQTGEVNYIFPLYLYSEASSQQTIGQTGERVPNLNLNIVKKFESKINYGYIEDDTICVDIPDGTDGIFYPINILDYIYAVLHSPSYREKYKEFLKIDFPRIPYPKDGHTFDQLVDLGSELRQIHLLESPVVIKYITQYPAGGSNEVEKVLYDNGNVYINVTQYFANVPRVAWEFYIGGYQPAQKWLKDRKNRVLNFNDIQHYQKIIVALTETDRLMKEIDKIEIE